jgi:hypothetical protein
MSGSVPADRGTEDRAGDETNEGDRHMLLIVLAILAAAAAGGGWWLRRPTPEPSARPDPRAARELGAVVASAYENDWATRFGVPAEQLGAALRGGSPDGLRRRIDDEVGVVDLRFDGAGRRGEVNATVIVSYRGSAERSTAKLTLPWDEVPGTVRADLIRDGSNPVLRKWRAA